MGLDLWNLVLVLWKICPNVGHLVWGGGPRYLGVLLSRHLWYRCFLCYVGDELRPSGFSMFGGPNTRKTFSQFGYRRRHFVRVVEGLIQGCRNKPRVVVPNGLRVIMAEDHQCIRFLEGFEKKADFWACICKRFTRERSVAWTEYQ